MRVSSFETKHCNYCWGKHIEINSRVDRSCFRAALLASETQVLHLEQLGDYHTFQHRVSFCLCWACRLFLFCVCRVFHSEASGIIAPPCLNTFLLKVFTGICFINTLFIWFICSSLSFLRRLYAFFSSPFPFLLCSSLFGSFSDISSNPNFLCSMSFSEFYLKPQ